MTGYNDPEAKAVLAETAPAYRRPWQLEMTSLGAVNLSPETYSAVERIFELFPSLPMLTIQVSGVDCYFQRSFPSGFTADVDKEIARIFEADPDVSAIAFPAGADRAQHTATRDDPYWSPDGKELAMISADLKAGKIGIDDARNRLKQMAARRVEERTATAPAP